MTKYIYYPGCAMDGSAKAYQDSLRAIAPALGLELEEIDDWNCCGATEYVAVSQTPAYALIGRNLALAEQMIDGTNKVIAPCSACYLNLAKTDHYMDESDQLRENVNTALKAGGLHYNPGSLQIRHLLDVIVNDIGLDAVRQKVTRPLKGLRVAPYIGCMVPRPDYNHRISSHEHPTEFDDLIKALGAEVVDYPLKAACCGGHMTQIGPEMAYELIRRLVQAADEYDADLMTALCPMCQMNIDAYQGEMNRHFHTDYQMPILFFTQLIGIAFGMDAKDLGFGKELVSASRAMKKIGVEAPEPEAAPRKPKRTAKDGLPMPQMGNGEEVDR